MDLFSFHRILGCVEVKVDLSTREWLGVVVGLASVATRPQCLDSVEYDKEGENCPEIKTLASNIAAGKMHNHKRLTTRKSQTQ